MARLASLFLISVLCTLVFTHSGVSKPLENSEIVIQDYKNFEGALNQDIQSLEIAKFLHGFVAVDAEFTMQLLDTDNQKTEDIEVNKTAYINSFLQGRKFLADYSAQIENIEVLSQTSDRMVVKHRMVENGVTTPETGAGQVFTSITDCTLSHVLDAGSFVVSGGACSMQVLINQDI